MPVVRMPPAAGATPPACAVAGSVLIWAVASWSDESVITISPGRGLVEDPLVRLVRSLQESIALDTVRNEYQLHRRIHSWLAEAAYRPDVETLNERVYAEVFLTPSSDPWLGLAPADVYTALPEGGVVGSGRVR